MSFQNVPFFTGALFFSSAALRSCQNVPFFREPFFCSSAAFRSCQNVPLDRWLAVDMDPDTTEPCRLFSSAFKSDQNVPFLATAPFVTGLTVLPGIPVILPCCRRASSSANCCMKFCCLEVMLSVTIFCGSDRNCCMKSARLSSVCAEGELSSLCTAIAPALKVSTCWDGSKKESSVSPLRDVPMDLASFPACTLALLISSEPD